MHSLVVAFVHVSFFHSFVRSFPSSIRSCICSFVMQQLGTGESILWLLFHTSIRVSTCTDVESMDHAKDDDVSPSIKQASEAEHHDRRKLSLRHRLAKIRLELFQILTCAQNDVQVHNLVDKHTQRP